MSQYTYKWHNYNLLISCIKCGDKMIFQSTKDKVECKSCGNIKDHSWKDALDFVRVEEIKKQETGSLQLMGKMDAKSSYSPSKNIDCYHCKTAIQINPEDDLKNFECKSCKKSLEFEDISNDLVLYSFKKSGAQDSPPSMVAVRCVSCGAPLEADPTKTNYDCKFCSTENILPPSLRYKVVINDVFIGVKKIFYPKELALTGSPEEVIKSLKQNKVTAFTEEELSAILKKHITHVPLYFELTGNSAPVLKDVEEEIFKTSKHKQQIVVAGSRLGKTQDEVNKRLNEVTPHLNDQEKKEVPKAKKGFFGKLFG